MKVLFYVQGEGRGHLTQSLAVADYLRRRGHELVGVGVGKPKHRELPDYIREAYGDQLFHFPTFELKYKDSRRLDKSETSLNFFRNLGNYWRVAQRVRRKNESLQPDLIINFYEPLAAMATAFPGAPCPVVSISHQNLFLTDTNYAVMSRFLDRMLTILMTRLASWNAHPVALSLTPMAFPGNGIRVCPPLLRPETKKLETADDGFALAYLLNPGYMEDVIRLSERHPEVPIKCFVAHEHDEEVVRHGERLEFHKISGPKFMEAMRQCSLVITTSGFETVAEAAWMGKPIFAIPVEGHYEQSCNAMDLQRCGLGQSSDKFDFDLAMARSFDNSEAVANFIRWQQSSERILDELLDSLVPEVELETAEVID